MSDAQHALTVAIAAAQEAGALLRAEFHRAGGPRGEQGKAPADAEAEALLRARITAAFPDDGFRAEELPSANTAPRSGSAHFWLVDPNDGTSAFLKGHRGASVSIARIRDGVPVLGVVFAYTAPDDEGDLIAWAEGAGSLQRNGVPIGHPGWPDALGAYDIVLISNSADRRAAANARLVAPARFRPAPGIAYRLALSAAGEGVAAISLFGSRDFDVAAGHALLRGVGGVLVDERGRPVRYHPDRRTRVGFCFGGGAAVVTDLARRPWSDIFHIERSSPAPGDPVKPAIDALTADAGLLARAQGCWLGQLCGDALGSQVEFRGPREIAAEWPEGVRAIRDGGTFDTLAGQPTDDSELALALARSLVQHGGHDENAVAVAYGQWLESRPFDCGNTIRQALAAVVGSERPADAARRAANHASQANGALMRLSPIAIAGARWPIERLVDVARRDAALTHPDPVCQDANALFAVAIAHAIRTGCSAVELWEFARAQCTALELHPDVVATVDASASGPPADFMHQMGWVRLALQNALHQLRTAPGVAAALTDTVGRGGDTDTNACIAGALLGAVHGRAGIPAAWRDLVRTCRPILGLEGVRRPRPRAYWPVDALLLPERLLAIGR